MRSSLQPRWTPWDRLRNASCPGLCPSTQHISHFPRPTAPSPPGSPKSPSLSSLEKAAFLPLQAHSSVILPSPSSCSSFGTDALVFPAKACRLLKNGLHYTFALLYTSNSLLTEFIWVVSISHLYNCRAYTLYKPLCSISFLLINLVEIFTSTGGA